MGVSSAIETCLNHWYSYLLEIGYAKHLILNHQIPATKWQFSDAAMSCGGFKLSHLSSSGAVHLGLQACASLGR